MSVVLVVFPGAPPVSPEALAKDAQLDQLIETKITGMRPSLREPCFTVLSSFSPRNIIQKQ